MFKEADSRPISGDPVARPRPRKLKAGAVTRSIAGRVLHPGHLVRAIKLQRGRKANKRAHDDAQLALLAQFLPGGYLHYGYFDDAEVDRCPREISIADIERAQRRYADLLIELATDVNSPVLDVGCGMGAMSKLLLDRGFAPTALTPDRLQAAHIAATYPQIPCIRTKFEDLPDPDAHAGRYGTVFTSESLQYLKLDRALPLLTRILKPGGSWIACDYFRVGPHAAERSGHRWEDFTARLDGAGWEIDYQRDITLNVLPTLRVAHTWATQFGLPLLKFVDLKFRVKQPALHYVLQGVFAQIDEVIDDHLQVIDPAVFASQKKYMLLRMRRR